MTEVSFYQLQRAPLEQALPQLLEKVVERGLRAVVIAASDERAEALNGLLWTYKQRSFLAHGTTRDGHAEDQPIYLTIADENPNGATVLVLIDGVNCERVESYDRCLDLFDGNDQAAVEAARARWKAHTAAGRTVTYWSQTASGGWEQSA